jgi:hypothetical protein
MVDEELSAAVRAHYEAWYQYRYDLARMRGEAVPSGKERFSRRSVPSEVRSYGPAIRELQAEADRVPDPGGPLGNYIDALNAWASTHPEIDPSAMRFITDPLIRDHR